MVGLGVWTAAGGVNDIISVYELGAPNGDGMSPAVESTPSIIAFGLQGPRIADWVLQTVVPVLYALFILAYTTRTDRRERLLLFVLVPFGLLYTGGSMSATLVSLVLDNLPGGLSEALLPFLQFAISISFFVTGSIVLLSLGQLWRTLHRYQHVSTRLTLGLAVIVPPVWFAERFFIALAETPLARAAIPVPFVILSTCTAWLAVTRFGLFEEIPAALAVARQDIVAEMPDAAITVTDGHSILDWNAATADLFEREFNTVVGQDLATILPDTFDIKRLLAGGQTTCRLPGSDRVLEASSSRITDSDDRTLGHTLIFRDITDSRQNARRAEVLSRVLRHNIRNRADVATAHLRQLTDSPTPDTADKIATTVEEELSALRDLGGTAREIESVLQADKRAGNRSVEELIRHAIEEVQHAEVVNDGHECAGGVSSVPVVIDTPPAETRANGEILIPVIRELVSNAVEHGGSAPEPHVSVRVKETSDTEGVDQWWIDVADSGAGISNHEVEVFEDAEEQPLQHGKGLGLWLVWWGVDRLGGEVSFDIDRGTTVTVELPGSLLSYE
ncbi:ATP-binding protein [Halorubrum ezzemoulense]|uniref:ATP-binding protein n=1 Tax=Halorubrum ezzemoulense TaxID=337243 RepID=UPI003D7DB69D